MKIKKNLSDADMLRSFSEKLTFENEVFTEQTEDNKQNKNKEKQAVNTFLPAEIEEKFAQLMLQLRTQLLKENRTNIKWRVKLEDRQIIIYPKDKG